MAPRWAVCLALASVWLGGSAARSAEPPAVRQLRLTVAETAGIRRFGYPVGTVLDLPGPAAEGTHFRLLEGGKPVVAQFRPSGARSVRLDFNVNHAPLESREYVVEYGPGVGAGPEPGAGVRVETTAEEFHVRHGPGLEFVVPRDLLGLLRQVRAGRTDYLRPGSPGLFIRYKDDIPFRAGGPGPDGVPTVARVVADGPLAAALRFEGTEALRGNRSVASAVEMEFPVSKSWVRVRWEVDDPHGYVAGLGAELLLNVRDGPTLVDFGAGSLVYAALRPGQAAALRAGPPGGGPRWQTLLGPAGQMRPYVVAAPGPHAPAAEGWAHVMDRERATAVALAGFADPGPGADLTVEADGRLRLWKHFAAGSADPPPGKKQIAFWLHFVGMPVQVGAATSPQAMLAPLRVTVRP